MKRHRRRRDADYHSQKTSVDWSKLVYMVKHERSGSLEVLQDAILTYFPRQFKAAQAAARKRARKINDDNAYRENESQYGYGEEPISTEVYVMFRATTARRRFELLKSHGSLSRGTPFWIHDQHDYSDYVENAVVWSTHRKMNVGYVGHVR